MPSRLHLSRQINSFESAILTLRVVDMHKVLGDLLPSHVPEVASSSSEVKAVVGTN